MTEVSITPLDPAHHGLVATWLSDPEINRFMYAEWRGRTVTDRLVSMIAANPRNEMFLVRLADEPVGLVALGEINHIDHTASIWSFLGVHSLRGRGILTEGMRLGIAHAFSRLNLHTLYGSIVDLNQASVRMLEKNGFERVGVFREGFCIDGVFHDRLYYQLVNAGPACSAAS